MSNLKYINKIISPQLPSRAVPAMDKNGYRKVVLGALNFANSYGEVYVARNVTQLFEESSRLIRRIKARRMYVEDGHPVWRPGLTLLQFKNKLLQDDQDKTCGHIRAVRLLEPSEEQMAIPGMSDESIIIEGEVAPSGSRANILEDSFNNEYEDTCFSIRGFTDPVQYKGLPGKQLNQIIKWDKVNEPGLEAASSARNVSLENYSDWTVEDIEAIKLYQKDMIGEGALVATESNAELLAELLVSFQNTAATREEVRGVSQFLKSKVFSR